jgi:VanZ family protein
MRRFLYYRLPALLWLFFVLWASGPDFASQQSSLLLLWVLQRLVGSVEPQIFQAIHVAIRKAAHLLEYAILSSLWFRAGRAGTGSAWRPQWGLLALGVALLTSVTDEAHQSFVASRTGSGADVVLDMIGAVTAQALLWMRTRRKKVHREDAKAETET